MKLELKHLAPYLPYGIKVISDENTKPLPVYGMFKKLLAGGGEELIYFGLSGQLPYSSKEYKPILRPIKDLCWSISVGNEQFVPIEWFEIGDDENMSLEFDYGNIKLIKHLQDIAEHNIISDIEFLPQFVVGKLLEWNFDVFGLIEQGLAIDINTI